MIELRSRLTESPERHVMDKIDHDLEEMRHHETCVLALLDAGKQEAALAEHDRFGRQVALEADASADQLASMALEHISMAAHDYDRAVARLKILAESTFAVALVLGLIFVSATVRSVSRPATAISRAAGEVARGDYAAATKLAAKCGGKSQHTTTPRANWGDRRGAGRYGGVAGKREPVKSHRKSAAYALRLSTCDTRYGGFGLAHYRSHVAAIYICSGKLRPRARSA